jgi:hypothetical protein
MAAEEFEGDRYRDNASRARRLAAATTDRVLRDRLLALAVEYERAAGEVGASADTE